MKMFHNLRVFVLFVLCGQITSSAIPIWELLSHQEKIGQLMYLFLNLVEVYCKNSPIPDCEKVLTLYGTSNLINQREDVLNLMDPYQRNARDILWSHVMNGAFKLPSEVRALPFPTKTHAELEDGLNIIGDYDINFPDYTEYQDASTASGDPHPYAVRVPAPNSALQSENHPTRKDESVLSYHQEPSNVAQVVSPTSQNIIPQSGSVTSIGNLNHQQESNSRNNRKDYFISSDKKLVPESRSPIEEHSAFSHPELRSFNNVDANKFKSAQNTYDNEEPSLLRIIKS